MHSSQVSGVPKYGLRKTKPIYSRPSFYVDMDNTAFYTLLNNLSWILAIVTAGLGFLYVFVKSEEKK